MRVNRNELPSSGWDETEHMAGSRMRQNGSLPDEWSARTARGLLYAPVPWIMRLIVAVHFRRLRVRHLNRLPARGPVLLVANHPATWMDVVVLVSALGRKLHFLAHESLFRPRPRAWILRLFGALPVAKRGDPAGRVIRNAYTFRRCRALLARGEVVAVFPEGVSAEDRSVGSLRTGAARITLDYLANGGPLALIPAGIHYADRTAFRSDVVVSIGRRLRLENVPAAISGDVWIDELTSRMRKAMTGLIVDLPDPSLRWLVEELTPPVPAAQAQAFESLRRMARSLARLRQRSPRAFAACECHARNYRHLRRRLRIAPGDLVGGPTAARMAFIASMVLPAFAGLLLNAPPAALTALVAARFPDPVRVGLARIVASIGTFAGWYAALVMVVTWITDSVWMALMAALAAAALGMLALIWNDEWSRVRGPTWILFLQWWRPRPLARLRREHETLRSLRKRLAHSPRRHRGAVAHGAPA